MNRSHDRPPMDLPADTYICLSCGGRAVAYRLAVGQRIECPVCHAVEANGVRNEKCKGFSELESKQQKVLYVENKGRERVPQGSPPAFSRVGAVEDRINGGGLSSNRERPSSCPGPTIKKSLRVQKTHRPRVRVEDRNPQKEPEGTGETRPLPVKTNRGREKPLTKPGETESKIPGPFIPCACGCGKPRRKKSKYATDACKMRTYCRTYRHAHVMELRHYQRERYRAKQAAAGREIRPRRTKAEMEQERAGGVTGGKPTN